MKPPRHYATEILDRMRKQLRSELKNVPEEYRGMIVDHVINSMKISYFKKKAGL